MLSVFLAETRQIGLEAEISHLCYWRHKSKLNLNIKEIHLHFNHFGGPQLIVIEMIDLLYYVYTLTT